MSLMEFGLSYGIYKPEGCRLCIIDPSNQFLALSRVCLQLLVLNLRIEVSFCKGPIATMVHSLVATVATIKDGTPFISASQLHRIVSHFCPFAFWARLLYCSFVFSIISINGLNLRPF